MRAQRFVSPPRYSYARSHESAASPVIRADLTGWPRHRAVIVGSARPPGGVRSIQTLGARGKPTCATVSLHAVVVSSGLKSSAIPCECPSATAWPVNGERAASSGSKPGFGARTSRSLALRPSTCAWATKALASGSTSAQAADRRCTTSLKEWKNTWRYLLERLLIQAFQRRSFQFTNRGCTAGSFPLPTPSISREQSGT